MRRKLILLIVAIFSNFFQISNGKTDTDDLLLRVVVYDKVNLREKPDLNSKVIGILRVTHVVKIIEGKNDIVSIGGNYGKWVYVDSIRYDNKGNEIKGWIFDYYLADKSKFVPVKEFKCNMRLYCSFGDFDYILDIKRNGTYVMNVIGEKEKGKGRFFIYKQAMIALDERISELDSMKISNWYYLRKDGIICNVGAGKLGGDACAECLK